MRSKFRDKHPIDIKPCKKCGKNCLVRFYIGDDALCRKCYNEEILNGSSYEKGKVSNN